MAVEVAAVLFLKPSSEILEKFPEARTKTVEVNVKNLKREKTGSPPYAPKSKEDFDGKEKFRYTGIPNSTFLPFCNIKALGYDTNDLAKEVSSKRLRIPNAKFVGDASGVHTGDEGIRLKPTEKALFKRASRIANKNNYSQVYGTTGWLGPNPGSSSSSSSEGPPITKIRHRPASSSPSGKRKSGDSFCGEEDGQRKRSTSNDRTPIDTSQFCSDIQQTIMGLRDDFAEQLKVMDEESKQEKELRKRAEERMDIMFQAWQQESKERERIQETFTAAMALFERVSKQDQCSFRQGMADDTVMDPALSRLGLGSVTAREPVVLGTLDRKTQKKLVCNATDYSNAFASVKGFDWAKHMLIGVYGTRAKYMRYHEPRKTDDPDLRRIEKTEFDLISDHYEKWIVDSLHIPKSSAVYNSFKNELGKNLGAAGRSLYTSPVTGNGAKRSGSYNKKASQTRVSSSRSSSVMSPVPPMEPQGLPGVAFAPPATSTQQLHDETHMVFGSQMTEIDGTLAEGFILPMGQTELLKAMGGRFYNSEGKEVTFEGEVSNDDEDEDSGGNKTDDDQSSTDFDADA